MSSEKFNETKIGFMDIIELPAVADGARRDNNTPAEVSFLNVQMVACGVMDTP
jgi:hypothetical protein